MRRIVIATIKSWNIKNVKQMHMKDVDILLISSPEELIFDKVNEYNPEYIFFIHWSWYIPKLLFNKFECIVFHPTPLPYGRGGSPIQNMIDRGFDKTKISAIRVSEELDGGPIYPVDAELSLYGTANEILMRMSKIVCFEMIPKILEKKLVPTEQMGEPYAFKRRTPEQSELDFEGDLRHIYDKIRMLDGEGYPPAYLTAGKYRLEFKRASIYTNEVVAEVVIRGGYHE